MGWPLKSKRMLNKALERIAKSRPAKEDAIERSTWREHCVLEMKSKELTELSKNTAARKVASRKTKRNTKMESSLRIRQNTE